MTISRKEILVKRKERGTDSFTESMLSFSFFWSQFQLTVQYDFEHERSENRISKSYGWHQTVHGATKS